jgi:hypothetical protein
LRALADYIKSNNSAGSVGWWFRVPTLSKAGGGTEPALTDDYLPCLGSPLGLGTDTLVEGLICLDFLKLNKNRCEVNVQAWNNFRTNYKLENLLEIELVSYMRRSGGKRHYYVKLGTTKRNAMQCIALKKADSIVDPKVRIPRRLGCPTKGKVKTRKALLRDHKKNEKEGRTVSKRADRRLRASIEEDILTPLGVESSSYHGGDLNGNAIRRLMEHAEGIALGVNQKLRECGIADRADEIDILTKNFRIVLLLLDGIFSLLLTKYGMVTPEILGNLTELLELLRKQWVIMGLPMTPKFHCLLRHAVVQLEATGGGLGDLGEDGIERSHQERLKDNRRMTGLRDFTRRTNSQAKMQYIRGLDTIKTAQKEVDELSKRHLKRKTGLADTRAEKEKEDRTAKRARAANDVRDAPHTGPVEKPRDRSLREAAEGKTVERAKL